MLTVCDHIEVDDQGTARIAGSRLEVSRINCRFKVLWLGRPQLHRQFPHLTLAQLHAAFVYYHDHPDQIDAEIARAADIERTTETQLPKSDLTLDILKSPKEPMSVKLYFDEHVHGVLAMTLPQRHVDLLTVQQDHHDAQPDSVIFARAIALDRVLVSSDAHMLVIAADYVAHGRHFNGLIYMRRAPLRLHLESLEYVATEALPHELFNKVLRLPL